MIQEDIDSLTSTASLFAKNSQFKGMILADRTVFGKTLSALATIAVSIARTGSIKGPCIIVTPCPYHEQWMTEIEIFFEHIYAADNGQIPSLCLVGKYSPNPLDLWKCKVVVTSYSYLGAEVTRVHKFIQGIDVYKKGKANKMPKRPKTVLLSVVLDTEPPRLMGEWLALGKVHTLKNLNTHTYHAVSKLRAKFDSCFMITNTPFENEWGLPVWPGEASTHVETQDEDMSG
ncbi:hypothetical protein ACHAO7_004873 [Fusarium culmorum]